MDNTQKLLEQAAGIRDAVLEGENTASRVGAMFVSIIQAMQHFPGQMVDASTIKFSNGKTATHITFNIIDSAGKTTAVDISVPAVSSTSAGLLTPEKAEEYDAAVTDVAAIKKRMPGAEKGLLLSGFRHGPTTDGVTFIFDAIDAGGNIVQQSILVPIVSSSSPGVVTKAQMDSLTATASEAKSMAEGAGTAANEAKVTAHGASVAAQEAKTAADGAAAKAQEAKGTASQAKSTAEGAATTANAAKTAADGAAKGVRDLNAVVGEPDGIATLDTNGKVPAEQVPALGYLPLTKVVGVDTQAHIAESIDLGYTGAGIYFVTDYNYGEGAFCKVIVTDGVVDFDDDGAQPGDDALRGYFLETLTGALWQMVEGQLERVPTRDALTEVTQQAKLALFVDMWNQACGNYGKYDPVNAPDAEHPYLLNDLWLTYQESMAIMLQYQSWGTGSVDFLWTDVKTNIRARSSSARTYSNSYNGLTVVNLLNIYPTSMHTCLRGSGLKRILNLNAAYMTEIHQGCFNAPNLEVLQISNLKINLDLSNCPLINLASWQGMVNNAANTEGITVTVHGDVYAKLTGDMSNAAAAGLSAAELAQWQAVATAATGKNITFATV